ncbi:MAG: PilZ domain-containing protein [Cyanobacteria bacterium NC_groundwater_1444_Ag_S-0.65um_54_12]|nr:PilZ domain-containing protein [Cyanobacteria bacterium NC_groundwater_1444_Ag_S-0.65um_54_12]
MPKDFQPQLFEGNESFEQERRRAPRVACEFVVEFYDPGNGRFMKGRVVDISHTGMRLRTKRPARLGQPQNLEFWFWINNKLLKVPGQLARRIDEDDLGIEFKLPSRSLKGCIAEMIDRAVYNRSYCGVAQRANKAKQRHSRNTMNGMVHSLMREGGTTYHDGLAVAKEIRYSPLERWLWRR